jgi:hypothetical protein
VTEVLATSGSVAIIPYALSEDTRGPPGAEPDGPHSQPDGVTWDAPEP